MASAISMADAPNLRRISVMSVEALMMFPVRSMWSVTGLGPDPTWPDAARPDRTWSVGCCGAAATMALNSSGGVAPASWAAAVDPAEVPMVRSAVVTSSPASNRPAMTPISHALPVEPPPPRTKARSGFACPLNAGAGSVCGWDWTDAGNPGAVVGPGFIDEEVDVFNGVAFREVRDGRSQWRLAQSRDRGLQGAPTVDTAFMGLTSCQKFTITRKLSLRRNPRNCRGRRR